MALIKLLKKNDKNEWDISEHNHDGLAFEWIVSNIDKGENFAVYDGDSICGDEDISRDEDKMRHTTNVTIAILPAGIIEATTALFSFAVQAVIEQLMPVPDLGSLSNNQAGSANNDLSNRKNKVRLNERIVDIVGEVLSVPDVIQSEYAFNNEDGQEVRIGAYCFGRNVIDVSELSDGENLISDLEGSAAGIYRPYTSPNNSEPYEQIGDAIDQPIVGVYQSTNAVNQTLEAPPSRTVTLGRRSQVSVNKSALTAIMQDVSDDVDLSGFEEGEYISLSNIYVADGLHLGVSGKMEVISSGFDFVKFSVANAPEFLSIPTSNEYYETDGDYNRQVKLVADEYDGDTYFIKRTKVDRLIFNVYAPNGLYKRSTGDKQQVSVSYRVGYYRLDDDKNRVGALVEVDQTITGTTDRSIGSTIDIDLGSETYIEWFIYRTSFLDTNYNGTVVDTIKLKSMYGLFDVDKEHFGNITIVQTKRESIEQVTSVANPEVNAICTEMVNEYLGSGEFSGSLSKNTQAMQSLIRVALDPKIGRLTTDDIDLDLLLETQQDNETYYQTDEAGRCSYSFDIHNMSAQEVFYLIADAASTILWREGRTLKSWFERPQSVPEMVFTHKSKVINSDETWSRTFKNEYDGVEFKYIDEELNSEETLTYPTDAINAKTYDIKGIRGEKQAYWRMYREYFKLFNQRESVDFTATPEGRFAKPSKLISVVKGTRIGQYSGYIRNVNLLTVELSQEVEFTDGDDHYLLLKTRTGGAQTVSVTATSNKRIVVMDFAPTEEIYTGNDAEKTEFSFGNEARLKGQLMLPQSIDPSDQFSTRITALNYSDSFYQNDAIQPLARAFSDGFSDGFA